MVHYSIIPNWIFDIHYDSEMDKIIMEFSAEVGEHYNEADDEDWEPKMAHCSIKFTPMEFMTKLMEQDLKDEVIKTYTEKLKQIRRL